MKPAKYSLALYMNSFVVVILCKTIENSDYATTKFSPLQLLTYMVVMY